LLIVITAKPCRFSRWAYYRLYAGNFKPSEEEEREFFSLKTIYHYHGVAVLAFGWGLQTLL